MLEIERLDAAISRIDLALQRADSRRQALERRPDLDPELSRLIGQAIELAALCTPPSAESIELLRAPNCWISLPRATARVAFLPALR